MRALLVVQVSSQTAGVESPSVLLRLRTSRAVIGPAETGDNRHRRAFFEEKDIAKGEKVSRINLSLDPTMLAATMAGARASLTRGH